MRPVMRTVARCCPSRQIKWCFFYIYFASLSEKDFPHNGKLLVFFLAGLRS